MTIEIGRGQALAYRMRALDLVPAPTPDGAGVEDLLGLGVLDLGVQDTPPGSARLSIATRLGAELDPFTDDRIAMAWTTRGSPHVHRAADLPRFADALWPLSDRDAVARLGGGGKALAATGMAPLDGFAIAVAGLAEVITGPMTKPEASAALTRHLPDELSGFCEPCGSVHIYELLFRCAALPAGIGIVAGKRPLTLAPIAGWKGSSPDPAATVDLLETYLARLGPATATEAASFVGTTGTEARRIWTSRSTNDSKGRASGAPKALPDGLVEVTADGRPGWFPEHLVDELTRSDPEDLAGTARLIAPGDPLLKGGDRDLLVSSLGTVAVSNGTASVTVTPFATLVRQTLAAITRQAELVAAVRGATTVDVTYDA